MENSINISDIKTFLKIKEGSPDFVHSRFSSINSDIINTAFHVDAFLAGFCLKGTIEISIGVNRFKLNPYDFIIIPPCEKILIHNVSTDFDCEEVVISNDFISKINVSTKMLVNFYFSVEQNHMVSIDDEETTGLILSLFDSISKLSKYYKAPSFKVMIHHYIYAFLHTISYIYEQYTRSINTSKTSKLNLLRRFFIVLQKHYKKQHSVNFYASQLCVTPKHLSKYIKSLTDRTAGEWIRSIIVLEAKIMLSKEDKFIQEIAQELNFSDQMAFSKFFKKQTGISPKNYKLSESE